MDTGTKGHMAWCRYSARVLLDAPDMFSGGGLYFRDEPDIAIFAYTDLVIYSNDDPLNEHVVARSRGDRRVLLMFMGGLDG